jgi:hypothetical protein
MPKYTIIDCQYQARLKNGRCLSFEYKGCHHKLTWQCHKGHIWKTAFNNIKNRGTWCPTCSGNCSYSLRDCQITANEHKGTCLSEQYINARDKMTWQCEYGHIWKEEYWRIRRHVIGEWCFKCKADSVTILRDCRRAALKNYGECLSHDYINDKIKMTWRCKEGHVFEKPYRCIRYKGEWCDKCDSNTPTKLEAYKKKRKVSTQKQFLSKKKTIYQKTHKQPVQIYYPLIFDYVAKGTIHSEYLCNICGQVQNDGMSCPSVRPIPKVFSSVTLKSSNLRDYL